MQIAEQLSVFTCDDLTKGVRMRTLVSPAPLSWLSTVSKLASTSEKEDPALPTIARASLATSKSCNGPNAVPLTRPALPPAPRHNEQGDTPTATRHEKP